MDAVATEGAELILHGHTHLATLSHIPGPRNDGQNKPVPVVCVPAAFQWLGGKHPPAGVNMISISGNPDGWKFKLARHGLRTDNTFGKIGDQ